MAVLRLLLFGLFVFLVVTVAAFVYLEWWQAIGVSFATFLLLVYAAKLVIRAAIGRLGESVASLFTVKSQVLRGATTDVHFVRPIVPPADALALFDGDEPDFDPTSLTWYEIEVTIFPDPAVTGPMTHWDIDDLRLVPADTPDIKGLGDNGPVVYEVELASLLVIENGEAVEPEGSKFHGPHRLRFTAAFPKDTRDWKFRYYFEQFGHVRLPAARLLG